MDKRYRQLTSEERGVILAENRRGASLREIGGLLGRSASTISRELLRGRPEGEPDQPVCAQLGCAGYRARRKRCGRRRKLIPSGWLHGFVRGKLIYKRWSPEQIAHKLNAIHSDDPTRLISHETIYAAIYAQPRGRLKAEMIAALNRPVFTGGQNSRRIAHYGTCTKEEDLEAVFT